MAPCVRGLGYLLTLLATAASADEVPVILKKSGCTSCHDESKARVGPSFKAMADRYRGDPQQGLERLSKKLRPGSGHPTPPLDDEQIKQITSWILQR